MPDSQTNKEAVPPTFGRFFGKFREHWFTAMSGGLSVPLTFVSIYLGNTPLTVLFGLLAVICLLWASYQVWRDSVLESETTIATLNSEIEKLKHGDYDEDHKRLVKEKLEQLRDISLDLIWFLLHHGKIEQEDLRKHCWQASEFHDAIQKARGLDLIRDSMATIPGRAAVQYFWYINPAFETVLQDLIGKRQGVYFR